VQHVDFQEVSADEKIHIKVPLHFVNAEKSPAIKEQGGLITHVRSEIDVAVCLLICPNHPGGPAALAIGHSIHVRALHCRRAWSLPWGPTKIRPSLRRRSEAAIAEEEEAAAAAAAAESRESSARGGRAAAADVPSIKQKAPKPRRPRTKGQRRQGRQGDKGDWRRQK